VLHKLFHTTMKNNLIALIVTDEKSKAVSLANERTLILTGLATLATDPRMHALHLSDSYVDGMGFALQRDFKFTQFHIVKLKHSRVFNGQKSK
jgi:hypothetical protein